jgi:hypothetical protein
VDWEQLFQRWETALQIEDNEQGNRLLSEIEIQACTFLQDRKLAEQDWLLAAFAGSVAEDERKRHFIRIALRSADQIPEWLFILMLRAAVYERDPSFNRLFILPCLRCFGPRRVNEELLKYLESGTDLEKGGAASAFYWSLQRSDDVPEEDIEDLRTRIRHGFLTEFVANEDADVRLQILPFLRLDPQFYPEELQMTLSQAIKLYRDYPDKYKRSPWM